MNKRKILTLTLSICMIAILAIGGSIAYLTDTDENDNVFTVGGVDIDQHEQERVFGEDGSYTKLQDFTQEQVVLPGVYEDQKTTSKEKVDVNGYEVGIRDKVDNYVDKIVSVENTGKSAAYVRTIIAVPVGQSELNKSEDNPNGLWVNPYGTGSGNESDNWLHYNLVSDGDTTPANGWYWGTYESRVEWTGGELYVVRNVEIDGTFYTLQVLTNVNPLPAGEFTGACMVGFYMDDDVDYDFDAKEYYIEAGGMKQYLGKLDNVEILVATQAVQADGFDDAWQAFNLSFEEITATNHPWAD